MSYNDGTWTSLFPSPSYTSPVASPIIPSRRGLIPFAVDIYDMSVAGSTWQLDYGDGTTEEGRIGSHVFTRPGKFTVRQSVSNPSNVDFCDVTINVLPEESAYGEWVSLQPWEAHHNFDREGDPDGDELTNFEELVHGTNPLMPDAASANLIRASLKQRKVT